MTIKIRGDKIPNLELSTNVASIDRLVGRPGLEAIAVPNT